VVCRRWHQSSTSAPVQPTPCYSVPSEPQPGYASLPTLDADLVDTESEPELAPSEIVSRQTSTKGKSMSSTTSQDGLLDIDGLADRLGVGERFVRRLVEERRIPYLKIGRLVRFEVGDVEAWIASQRVEPNGPQVTDRHRRLSP